MLKKREATPCSSTKRSDKIMIMIYNAIFIQKCNVNITNTLQQTQTVCCYVFRGKI